MGPMNIVISIVTIPITMVYYWVYHVVIHIYRDFVFSPIKIHRMISLQNIIYSAWYCLQVYHTTCWYWYYLPAGYLS